MYSYIIYTTVLLVKQVLFLYSNHLRSNKLFGVAQSLVFLCNVSESACLFRVIRFHLWSNKFCYNSAFKTPFSISRISQYDFFLSERGFKHIDTYIFVSCIPLTLCYHINSMFNIQAEGFVSYKTRFNPSFLLRMFYIPRQEYGSYFQIVCFYECGRFFVAVQFFCCAVVSLL